MNCHFHNALSLTVVLTALPCANATQIQAEIFTDFGLTTLGHGPDDHSIIEYKESSPVEYQLLSQLPSSQCCVHTLDPKQVLRTEFVTSDAAFHLQPTIPNGDLGFEGRNWTEEEAFSPAVTVSRGVRTSATHERSDNLDETVVPHNISTSEGSLETSNPRTTTAQARPRFGRRLALPTQGLAAGASGPAGPGNQGIDSTGAYIHAVTISDPIGENYCTAVPNSTGSPSVMSAFGSDVASDNNVTLVCSDLPSNVLCMFLVSMNSGFVPFPNGSLGNLCLLAPLGLYSGPGQIDLSNPNGEFRIVLDLPNTPQPSGPVPIIEEMSIQFQTWHRESYGFNSNFSDGLKVEFR